MKIHGFGQMSALAAVSGLIASTAVAGSLATPVPEPVIAPAAVVMPVQTGWDWTGAYVGASLGYGETEGSDTIGTDMNGMVYGLHGGYLQDMGSFVLGGEIQYETGDILDPDSGLEIDSTTRLKLRAGYDAGQFLPYLTAGWSRMSTLGAIEGTDDGYNYGIGLEYQISDTLRIGAELLRDHYDDFAASGTDIDSTSISARVSYTF